MKTSKTYKDQDFYEYRKGIYQGNKFKDPSKMHQVCRTHAAQKRTNVKHSKTIKKRKEKRSEKHDLRVKLQQYCR